MNNATRRGFLSMAAAGAAAVGAVAVGASTRATHGAAAPAATGPDTPDGSEGAEGAEGSLIAYVDDLSAGEVTFMLDGHEVVVTDRALVAKLARAAASDSRA